MKTILITGCSSGFGVVTAQTFLERGWKVIATMRSPSDDVLPRSEHLRVLALDVTDANSIARAVESAGPIDVLGDASSAGVMHPDLRVACIAALKHDDARGVALRVEAVAGLRGFVYFPKPGVGAGTEEMSVNSGLAQESM